MLIKMHFRNFLFSHFLVTGKTGDKSGCDKLKHAQTVYNYFIKQHLSKVQIQGKDSYIYKRR